MGAAGGVPVATFRAEERRVLERQCEAVSLHLQETASALRESQAEILRLKELETRCEVFKSLTEVRPAAPSVSLRA